MESTMITHRKEKLLVVNASSSTMEQVLSWWRGEAPELRFAFVWTRGKEHNTLTVRDY